jgi:hypothetical protein
MVNISPEVLWGVGIIILGLVLVYGVVRAGRLRRDERERIDRRTIELQKSEQQAERATAAPDFGLKPNLPYAIIVPIVVAAFAVGLMIWSMHGTSMRTQQSSAPHSTTTGQAIPRQTNQPVPARTAPGSDASGDSWRGQHTPVNR